MGIDLVLDCNGAAMGLLRGRVLHRRQVVGRSMAMGAKIQFIETKIDALLDHFDVGFEESFREHMAEVLREQGEHAARAAYILVTGNSAAAADLFVQDLVNADEDAKPSQVGPPHEPVNVDELHELVDMAFQQPRRRPRRKRK